MKPIKLAVILLLLTACGEKRGQDGRMGPAGPLGAQGDTGAKGVGCTVSHVGASPAVPNGGSLITCSNGSQLVTNGNDGTDGIEGPAGSPGTVITSQALCPATTTYPSTFTEVAFCIDNELYAVYSANGGFLTHLVPGAYSSNGINSSCSFAVLPGCVVQR